ncbi:MAG: hypothetical protein R3E79_31135 [Caldilineaceae bacterium]
MATIPVGSLAAQPAAPEVAALYDSKLRIAERLPAQWSSAIQS